MWPVASTLNTAALKRLVVRKCIWLIQTQVTETHLLMDVWECVCVSMYSIFNIALVFQVGKCCTEEHSIFINTSVSLVSTFAAGQ